MKLDKTVILIKKAALEFDKTANHILAEYDLTPAQYKLLKYINEESKNGVRIKDLEQYYSMTHATVIGVVSNLEKKGFISYKENETDARSRHIIITKKAHDMKDELEKIGITIEHQLTKNLSKDERILLVKLLRKLLGVDDGQ